MSRGEVLVLGLLQIVDLVIFEGSTVLILEVTIRPDGGRIVMVDT